MKMVIDDRIIGILSENKRGITITELADKLNTHRHTITKYIYRLEGESKIKIRKVGIAKLCYLNLSVEQ